MKSGMIIEHMLAMAQELYNSGMYEKAARQYKQVVECDEVNTTALYNLGVLYATGRGVDKDLITAAKHFRKAVLYGDDDTANMELKCIYDYMMEITDSDDYEKIFKDMARYEKEVFDSDVAEEGACKSLYDFGVECFEKKSYKHAYNAYRAAAQFAGICDAYFNLGVMYINGAGIEKNDLYAMYWLDKAADTGDVDAQQHSEGIFKAYSQNLQMQDFVNTMSTLISACSNGSFHIPKDPDKAIYWKAKAERILAEKR